MLYIRTISLLLLTLGGTAIANAQDKPKKDSLPNAQVINADQLKSLLPQITPKSPTVAALARYGDYSVSLYTGVPTIEIPIHEFKVGAVTVPIKLTYHASGVRVNDLPSWVGLGWSLQTGGIITRNVQSRPDQETAASGLIDRSVPTPNPDCLTPTINDLIRPLANNETDSQRDLFAYRSPSGSNTFMLFPNYATPAAPNFVLLRSEPVQIQSVSDLTSFTVVETDGTLYRYSDAESTFNNTTTPNQYANYTSAWYLSEITSATNNDRALYTYSPPINQNSSPELIDTWVVQGELNETGTNDSGVQTGLILPPTSRDAGATVGTRYPTEIQFPGGKIQLGRRSRSDDTQVLDYIDILGYNVSTAQFERIKRFTMHYSTQNGIDDVNGSFLKNVRIVAQDGTTIIGSYGITYNQTALPGTSSRAKDYWGYYNGQTGTTLIAQRPFVFKARTSSPANTTITIGDANREPNETYMKAGSIAGISYPTGGYTEFDFETNRYESTNTLAGGLRVKQIRAYTTAGQLATRKTYSYGTGTFRSNLVKTYTNVLTLNYYEPAGTALPQSYNYKAWTFTSAPNYPLTPDEGSPVTYPSVTEYQENGSGVSIGKTVYTYRDDAVDAFFQPGGGRSFLNSRSWDRGQLTSQTTYDTGNNLRSRVAYAYSQLASGQTTEFAGTLIWRAVQQIGTVTYPPPNGCMTPADDYTSPRPLLYRFQSGLTKPISTSTYQYADDNSGRYTLHVEQTDYATGFYQPRETRLLAEGGIVLGTEYYYPQDYGIITATTSPELLGIKALQSRNMYVSIESVRFRRESASSGKDYKTGQFTSFTPATLNGLPTALPYQTYLLEAELGTFSANAYKSAPKRYIDAEGGDTFLYDPRYALRLKMPGYDAYGNLLRYEVAPLTNGPATAFTYSTYTPTGGVTFSTVSSHITNKDLTTAQTTQYTYKLPLLGPDSMTDPRGVKTSYFYDNIGRLQTIKDHNGKVLKHYTYNYITGQ